MAKIFIIDDNPDTLMMMKIWSIKKGIEATTFSNSKQLNNSLLDQRPDLFLIDINLENEDGRDICLDLKKRYHYPFKIILFSGDSDALENYRDYNADGILNKPFGISELDKIKHYIS